MRVLGALILVLLSACSRPAEESRASTEAPKIDVPLHQAPPQKPDCDLYIRGVEPDQTLTPYPFIRPDHVRSIEYLESSSYGAGWMFFLTKDARIRVYQHTSKNVGSSVAIFCGKQEISRPRISTPFADPVVIYVKDLNT